jgi:hypothetical protein
MYRDGKAIHLFRREDRAFKQVLGTPSCGYGRNLVEVQQHTTFPDGELPIRKLRQILSVNSRNGQGALNASGIIAGVWKQTAFSRSYGVETENATAFRQWRSWLRGVDLNHRPLGYELAYTIENKFLSGTSGELWEPDMTLQH